MTLPERQDARPREARAPYALRPVCELKFTRGVAMDCNSIATPARYFMVLGSPPGRRSAPAGARASAPRRGTSGRGDHLTPRKASPVFRNVLARLSAAGVSSGCGTGTVSQVDCAATLFSREDPGVELGTDWRDRTVQRLEPGEPQLPGSHMSHLGGVVRPMKSRLRARPSGDQRSTPRRPASSSQRSRSSVPSPRPGGKCSG